MESQSTELPVCSEVGVHGVGDDERRAVARHPLLNDATPASNPKPAIQIWNAVRSPNMCKDQNIHRPWIDHFQVTLEKYSELASPETTTGTYQCTVSGRYPTFTTTSDHQASQRCPSSCFSEGVNPVPFALRKAFCLDWRRRRSSPRCANWRMTYRAQNRQDQRPRTPGLRPMVFLPEKIERGFRILAGMIPWDPK